jgi:hypothetical protein
MILVIRFVVFSHFTIIGEFPDATMEADRSRSVSLPWFRFPVRASKLVIAITSIARHRLNPMTETRPSMRSSACHNRLPFWSRVESVSQLMKPALN